MQKIIAVIVGLAAFSALGAVFLSVCLALLLVNGSAVDRGDAGMSFLTSGLLSVLSIIGGFVSVIVGLMVGRAVWRGSRSRLV